MYGDEEKVLGSSERAGAFTLALVSLLIGLWLALAPLQNQTVKTGPDGKTVSTVASPRDSTELSVLFVAAGLLLFTWALNGLRLTRVSWAGMEAEAGAPELQAAKTNAAEDTPIQEVTVGVDKDTEPEESVVPKGKVFIHKETELVYSLEALPLFVMEDLFKVWPTDLQKPESFSEFEFASRRKGKGNMPWLIKFQGLPNIKVSYGGHAKKGPSAVAGPQAAEN